jgi:hypothetical protein
MGSNTIFAVRTQTAPWPSGARLAMLLAPAVVLIVLGALLMGPLQQPLDYHQFHDARALFGIPNVWNVVSNLPFVAIGAAGLAWLARAAGTVPPHLARCYQVMFAGVLLTGFGSASYHWAPGNASLIWDRLPIALGFMALFAGFVAERLVLPPKHAIALLAALSIYGAGSVATWAAFDDLRFYLIAQFYPLLTIPVILWLTPPRMTRGGDWLIAIGFYVVAKAAESLDGAVFALGGLISGHTLKHVLAAAGAYWIYGMLRRAWSTASSARIW